MNSSVEYGNDDSFRSVINSPVPEVQQGADDTHDANADDVGESSFDSDIDDKDEGGQPCLFQGVHNLRSHHKDNVIISHLNVNSVYNKITEIKELQRLCHLDVLVLSETKLDDSFKQEPLDIDGYSCIRQDKRSNSGGLMTYISNDIPYSRGNINVCNNEIECMSIELNVSDEKIMLLCVYKNPKTDPVIFKTFFEDVCEKTCDTHDNIIVIGDLNFNMQKENILSSIAPTFNLQNIIATPTCFKSNEPTLIDVMLVTKRRKILRSFSEKIGISDFHNLIGGILRLHKPAPKIKVVTHRNISKINYENVLNDLTNMNLSQAILSSNSANCAFELLQNKLVKLLNNHAPKKKKVIKKKDFHCMSKELRKAIYHRNKLRNKYYKTRSDNALNAYKIQRNTVTQIKRKEIGKYFAEKCKEGTRNKDFWKAVKPLFSKSRTKSDSITLRENGEIVSDDHRVCRIFNSFFQSIGSDIGPPENNDSSLREIMKQYESHPSVKVIKNKIKEHGLNNGFIFRFVTELEVRNTIKQLSVKKAAGFDELPAQFIKKIATGLIKPLTLLINRCILENVFPHELKKANITPVFKKKDKLNKDNYRSVNILPILSKVMERIMYNQVYEHMSPLFHKYLSGFREGHSCQDVLVRMTEDWRDCLDKGSCVGIVAIDLSKAFDCMPHSLLLAKLAAYGFDSDACIMMKSYLMDRQQRVKIGDTFSNWANSIKGVPQGSILGPLLFNIFINDFLFGKYNSTIYNYADDNTICCHDDDQLVTVNKLEEDCLKAMQWFELNRMKANASKFQVMFISRNNNKNIESITVGGQELKVSKSINILGVELDRELKYNSHMDNISRQAGKQVNAVKRMKHYLDKRTRNIIYNSYINCNFSYCSVVWMFANKTNLEKLERTNKRALRVVTNKDHLHYEELCQQEKKLNVFQQCMKSAAIMMYKVRQGTAPPYIREMFEVQETEYDMRDNNRLVLPQFNTINFGKNSFKYIGAKLWNNIPPAIKNKPSLNTFKSDICKFLLSEKVTTHLI